ncbi:hypothetical protein K4K59_010888 [Colletotrichum sp. SAR11_240]|nr:hypothetical protein K4K59_010888 [Colletotrichum sp. SAR11_240]
MPLSPAVDTAGFLAHDPNLLNATSKALYKSNYTSYDHGILEYPKTMYVSDFPTRNSSSSQRIHKFSQDLPVCLNTMVTVMSLENAWKATAPAVYATQTLSEFLNLTYTVLITKVQARLLRSPFYRGYTAVHNGRLPFVDPVPLMRWACGDAQPDSYYPDGVHNKTVFTD